ncbi:hypothetical protein G8770_22370 [Aestuariicella hydrocarbonica]|uniref:Tryptophan synthase subunit beta like protein n=1 Tax=Pseudomaricurvus hydrocarbonicus TaxID=1470433 RepID=A0A9E5MQ10_9GAMM|nr:hypothetical protein [Aestuariicella hydrocarbonica]NHO68306.1 hypothetical protein [Aestuariicella hydrocarbonica]
MPYAIRNQQGQITALLNEVAIGAEEYVTKDNPDVKAFLQDHSTPNTKAALAESDKGIVRVTEDLIHLLISKNIILFTELPKPVQQKLLDRERMRSSLQEPMDNFLDDGELI